MAVLVLDSYVEQQVLAGRIGSDGDQYDEVWDGVYVVTPLPNNDHQAMVGRLSSILADVGSGTNRGQVFPGVNLSDRDQGWEHNYREPDVAVFLRDGRAIDRGTHWQGAADFLVEIISPGERTYDKLPFYGRVGVVELLIINRDPWTLELFRQDGGQLVKAGQSTPDRPDALESRTVGLSFQLAAGETKPEIRVVQPATGREWRF